MPFVNNPGVVYLDPIDWHPDPYPVITGGDPHWGTYWHPTTDGVPDNDTSRFLARTSHDRAGFIYNREFGGPFPSDDPACGFLRGASLGNDGSDFWTGTCPSFPVGTFSPTASGGNDQGSFWSIANNARSGIGGGNQSVGSLADLTGWTLMPWNLPSNFDQYMNDAALEAEWNASLEANPYPGGPGWFIDMEAFHPFFESLEYAPDEPFDTAASDGYDGDVYWINNPSGWAYYAQSGDEPAWLGGTDPPGGGTVAVYDGGDIDWLPAPAEWVPTQTDNRFTCEFETPEFESPEWWDGTSILTLAHGDIVNQTPTAGSEGTTTTAGRFHQTLAFRVTWRLPKWRWARERTTVVRQYPRDDSLGLGSATRLYPPPKRHRLAGGYQ